MIRKALHKTLLGRLNERRRFVQVLVGPRQVGKTTLVRQVMETLNIPAHYASADEPTLRDRAWLEQQWDIARLKAKEGAIGALLVIDEIQKVADWSSVVKLLWDADTHSKFPLKVVLLGSSPLLIQSEMIGHLVDAGNTTTLAHYLDLLHGAGMLAGLSKYSHGQVRQRGSSPKLQVLNTALMTAQDHRSQILDCEDLHHVVLEPRLDVMIRMALRNQVTRPKRSVSGLHLTEVGVPA